MDDIEIEIETAAERIKLLKKQLSTATHKKCLLLAELKKLSELEEQLSLKLSDELTKEKMLRDNRIEKSTEISSLFANFNTVETEIMSMPLNVVELYGYSDVTSDVDANSMQVQCEEVTYSEDHNAPQGYNENKVTHNESTSFVDNVGSYDIVTDSLQASQSLGVDSEMNAIIAAFTGTVQSSSSWQDNGSCSNTSNNYSPLPKRMKKDADQKRSMNSSHQVLAGDSIVEPYTRTCGRLVCAICNKEFQRFLRFKSHMLTHNKDSAFSCAECNLKFLTHRSYNAHMRKHTGEKPFACGQCNRSFALRYSLTNHLKLHTGQFDHLCTVCGKGYVDNAGLKQHMTTHTLTYSCEICEKRFANSQAVINHKFVHTNEFPFVCNVCGHAVKTSKGLGYHMNTHNEIRTHACQLCDSRFHQAGHLRSHMRTHTGEMPFACKKCSMSFSNGYKLKLHLLTHGDVQQTLYACTQCDKTFVVSGSLKAHLLTHTQDTPYRCDNCDKQYKRSFDLRVHRAKVHRGLLTPAELKKILSRRSKKIIT